MGIKHIHVKRYQYDKFINFAIHKKNISVLSLTTQLY